MVDWINTVLQGLLLGGLYALFATGLSLSFGIMRLVNIAHGDMIVLAAYLAYAVVTHFGINPFVALLLIVPAMAAWGYVLQRVVLSRSLTGSILTPLMVTLGLSIITQNVLVSVFSADSRAIPAGGVETAAVPLGGGVTLGLYPLIVMATAIGVIVGLQLLLGRTELGRAFRATSDDQETAQLMGIDNRLLYGLAMAIAMGIVGLAGVYLGIRANFDPSAGPSHLIYAFEAVVIGGLGSLWGTLAGGMILGVSQSIGFRLDPGWGILASHLAFLAVLVLKSNGLFPRTRDR